MRACVAAQELVRLQGELSGKDAQVAALTKQVQFLENFVTGELASASATVKRDCAEPAPVCICDLETVQCSFG